MIPKQIVGQVAEAARDNIVSIVSDYVRLKRSGASYMGCCPFHNERTPSFNVNPAKGFFYCFGCHKHGSAIDFVMEVEHLNFPDAIRHLGNRFGIAIPEEERNPAQMQADRDRDALLTTMEFAARAFEANLRTSDEGQAQGLANLRNLGFRDDAIADFRLGYAIASGNDLTTKALAAGYDPQTLSKSGLMKVDGETGVSFDFFRGQVIFPVQDASGKVIAFGGRAVDAADSAYVSSAETAIFKTADALYGIYQARNEISKKGRCYIAGSPADVIALHQSGVGNVVASASAALTPNQIRLIKRFTNNVTVVFGGNGADVRVSFSLINTILREDMKVRILILPDGDTPCDFALKHTPEDVQAYVASQETDFILYEANTLMAECGSDAQKRIEAAHAIVESLAAIQDPIAQQIYAQECARIIGISDDAISLELENLDRE